MSGHKLTHPLILFYNRSGGFTAMPTTDPQGVSHGAMATLREVVTTSFEMSLVSFLGEYCAED